MASGKRLQGKVAIVTGGGSGFGAAIAKRFSEEGALILIGDISEEGMQKTLGTLANSGDHTSQKFDVTNEDAWKQAVDTCLQRWNRVDIVINNAGASYKNKPTSEVTPEEFDKVFNVNVRSVFNSVRAVVPQMQKQKSGVFVNISSIGSTRPRPGLVWYNSSKAAVSNATKALAAEYGPDQIRFNAICPLLSNTGLFETFAGKTHTPENLKALVAAVPLGRLAEPTDIANAALYLASEEASFVTGVALDVEGGKGI